MKKIIDEAMLAWIKSRNVFLRVRADTGITCPQMTFGKGSLTTAYGPRSDRNASILVRCSIQKAYGGKDFFREFGLSEASSP